MLYLHTIYIAMLLFAQLKEMYRTVRRTKKLPLVVEEIGQRTFAAGGLPAQRQVIMLVSSDKYM